MTRMGGSKRTHFLRRLITLGTVPHARCVDYSSRGDGILTFKAVYTTSIVVGLAIATEPVPRPDEIWNFFAFDV
jgi:hypothetical protein